VVYMLEGVLKGERGSEKEKGFLIGDRGFER
jgi:hypothetical protein